MSGVAVALAVVAACGRQESGLQSPVAPSAVTSAVTRQVERGLFEVCKDYVGTVGPAVTINVTFDAGSNGSIDQNFNVQLSNGQCQEVFSVATLGAGIVTVTETPVPTGYTVSNVRTSLLGGVITDTPSQTNTASGNLGDGGHLVVFTNTADAPPPPPGAQGCTPGYWKQDHHFDSWPSAYSPNQLFGSVFENAFPGMTLVQVLGQGGGGLKALGRHTVAALLNGASNSGVNYGMTSAQVIAAFNAVFPGGDYEGLHLRLAALNERTCPLN